MATDQLLVSYLDEVKKLVVHEITGQLQTSDAQSELYSLMLDYPLRGGKGLRPALAVAMCRGVGGSLDAIMPTAAILELYHNAFLIHDDVEDESLARRGRPTLHLEHGVPIAVNVGDAMLCLSLQPLLDNTARIGLGPALQILQVIAHMTKQSVEGQARELQWIRRNDWQLNESDYFSMVLAKTGWYSFIAPLQIGAIAGRASPTQVEQLQVFGADLSIAFQITDDLLNLDSTADGYGKELGGDLWEGKRTLPLLHALRCASDADRRAGVAILGKPRPGVKAAALQASIDALVTAGQLDREAGSDLRDVLYDGDAPKSAADVEFLAALIEQHDSVAHAAEIARTHSRRAAEALELVDWLPSSRHRELIESAVAYVCDRRV